MAEDRQRTRRGLLAAAAGVTAVSTAGCFEVTTPADIAAATNPRGNVEYFVGTDWAREHRQEHVVLDARQQHLHRAERIRGARRVPVTAIARQTETDEGRTPDVEPIATAFGDLGVTPDDAVLVYGDSIGARVTRTVFALSILGHRGAVRIINGGMGAWTGRLGTGSPSEPTPSTYTPTPEPAHWVDREWVADRVGTFNAEGPDLVDVRQPDAFLGTRDAAETAPSLARQGHIPGAVNYSWLGGNIAGDRIPDPADLYRVYTQDVGLDPDEPAIVYGHDNIDATQTWVTLRSIGFEDVRVYVGGFSEWANGADAGRYPIETSTNAVIEANGTDDDVDGGDFTCT